MTVSLALATAVVLGSLVLLYASVRGPVERRSEHVAGAMSLFLLGMALVTPFLIPASAFSTITQVIFLAPSVWFLVESVRFTRRRKQAAAR